MNFRREDLLRLDIIRAIISQSTVRGLRCHSCHQILTREASALRIHYICPRHGPQFAAARHPRIWKWWGWLESLINPQGGAK